MNTGPRLGAFSAGAVAERAWRQEALCSGVDPGWFFSDDRTELRMAARLCRECPVRIDCLQEALEFEDGYGVWGGLLPYERRRLTLRRRLVSA